MTHKVAAEVIVVNGDNKVLLLKRSETDTKRPLQWDLPGGHAKEHELGEEAAVRETLEETGIELSSRNLQLVYAASNTFEDGPNVSWLYFVAHTKNPDVGLSDEHTEAVWMKLNDAVDAVEYEWHKKALEYIRDNNVL